MANFPASGPFGPYVSTTTLGNVSLSGSSPWTSTPYRPTAPAYARVGCGTTSMEMSIQADKQHRGQHFVLLANPPSVPQMVNEITWEIFVTPPATDLEDVARTAESFSDRPLWETPAGFFLSAMFSVDFGATTRWLYMPLATVAVGGLRTTAQHLSLIHI